MAPLEPPLARGVQRGAEVLGFAEIRMAFSRPTLILENQYSHFASTF